MSRRNTIIISVLVNAVLLIVLFITAINSKNKNKIDQKLQNTAILEETTIDAKELFSPTVESKDLSVISPQIQGSDSQNNIVNQTPIQSNQQEYVSIFDDKNEKINGNDAIVYKLPQIENKTDNVLEDKIIDSSISSSKEVASYEVKVKKGDTLDKIAKRNHVKISEITKLNSLPNSFLKIGQTLKIPSSSKESYHAKTANKTLSNNNFDDGMVSKAEYYTIKVGDNPYTIALKNNIKPNDLLKINKLDEKKAKKLKPGDKLRIR
ncbi:MAG: LysM peptidoglycan-binding domain-containing protein [Parachlamydiales bacterium]|jgi:LysM repeat protein